MSITNFVRIGVFLQKNSRYGKKMLKNLKTCFMAKKHTIKKETNYDAKTGNLNIIEEHVIIEDSPIVEKHDFLQLEDEEEEDLMFVGKKENEEDEIEDSPTLYIINNDDNFW